MCFFSKDTQIIIEYTMQYICQQRQQCFYSLILFTIKKHIWYQTLVHCPICPGFDYSHYTPKLLNHAVLIVKAPLLPFIIIYSISIRRIFPQQFLLEVDRLLNQH